MSKLKLTIATTDYDHFRDFRFGLVNAEGIEHNWLNLGHHEVFARFTFNREWDVTELSCAKFSAQVTRDNPDIVGLPVICSRLFRFSSFYVNKKSGIKTLADLTGKKLGAPVFDAGRRAFPIFAKANGVGNVAWTAMDPPLRETMLVRGDVDAITGFTFTSLLNIEARGVKAEDVTVLQYPDYGVKLYGNAIIASPKILKENPAAVKAFLAAFTKGAKDVIADPAKAIETVKARDGIINTELETRRLKLAIDTVINSADARAEGFGQINGGRLSLMASQVSDAFNTKTRVKVEDIWNGGYLPAAKELDILPKGKK